MTQFIPVVFPQPGEDLNSWARATMVQLELLQRQLTNLTVTTTNTGGSTGGGPATTPITTPTGEVIMNVDGFIFDKEGRVIVSSDGIFVYDLTGYPVIEGPHVRINTEHLADNAVKTAQLAAGAIVAVHITQAAIEAPHIKAGAITAGKLAVNAIVANDGVIGTAAIVDAMIDNVHANKITAGDISAERIAANIVTALNGKFATLSALVASLGVVQIKQGGALITEGIVSEMQGDGVWIADNKFRAGNPTGSYIHYDGAKLTLKGQVEIVDTNGNILLASGISMDWQTLSDKVDDLELEIIDTATLLNYMGDDNYLTPVEKKELRRRWDAAVAERPGIRSQAQTLLVSTTGYDVAFAEWAKYLNGGTAWVSGYPSFISDVQMQQTNSISGAMYRDRSTTFYTQRQILLNGLDSAAANAGGRVGFNIFKPNGQVAAQTDLVAEWNRITQSNISTFIADAAFGTAQIRLAAITNALIADAAVNRAKIQAAAIDTLLIEEEAVVIPRGSNGQFSASVSLDVKQFPTSFAVIATFTQGTGKAGHTWRIWVDGTNVAFENPIAGTTGAMSYITPRLVGGHSFSITCDQTSGDGRCGIVVLGCKR